MFSGIFVADSFEERLAEAGSFRSNLTVTKFLMISEEYSEPCQLSKIQLYAKIVNGSKPWTIFAKNPVLDVRIFLFTVNNIFIFFPVEYKISVKARSIIKTS